MARLTITDEQRSMIASQFIAGRGYGGRARSMCCAPNRVEICTQIVGEEFALRLVEYAHEELGCERYENRRFEAEVVQRYLDKIAELEFLDA